MTSLKTLLSRPRPQEHLVQFTGLEGDLVRNVARYLQEGAARGDWMIVIATPAHRKLFAEQVPTEALTSQGRLAMLDAEATLARFMKAGRPDWILFDDSVGRLVRETRLRAGDAAIRAYGEMVDLLWKGGNLGAATALEEFWNRLLEAERFSLFCAYTVNLLGREAEEGALQEMLSTHSHLLPVRANGELEVAVGRALREVLGAARAAALEPLVRANQQPRTVVPGAEAAVLWLRRNLPRYAPDVLERSRAYYEEECARTEKGRA